MPGHHPRRSVLRFCVAVLILSFSPARIAAAEDWDTFMDGNFMSAIAAEAGGRVWVASSGGALGFDPTDSTTTRLFRDEGLPDQDLSAVAVDAAGNRWFGSRERGLQVQSAANGRFLRRPLDQFDLGSDSVRVLVAAGDSVWVGTASGAALLTYPPDPDHPESAVLLTLNLAACSGQSPLVNAIAVRGDTTWFATQRGVVRRTPEINCLQMNSGLTSLDVRALAFYGGSLWAGTAASVFRFEEEAGGVWVERAGGLRRGRPYLSFATFAGSLHTGTLADTASIYRFDLPTLTWSGASSGVSDRNAVGLVPAAGTLWVATNRGLYRRGTNDIWQRIPSPDPPGPLGFSFNPDYRDVAVVDRTPYGRAITGTFMTELGAAGWSGVGRGQRGIEATELWRVLVDREGRTWLGHCCCSFDSLCRLDRLDSPNATAIGYPAFNILALTEAPDGRIWAGSVTAGVPGNGLYRIDPATGEIDNYRSPALPMGSRNSITALAFDASGRLWIGHSDQGIDVWSNPGTLPGTITNIGPGQGLPSLNVNSIAIRGEEAWVGTAAGIGVFAGTAHLRTIPGASLPSSRVLDLAVDGCGRVWAATAAGVVLLSGEGDVLEVFDNDALPAIVDERANRIDVDLVTGTLWFATANGLSRFVYDRSCAEAGAAASARLCTRLCPYPNPFDPGRGELLGVTDVGPTGTARITVLDLAGRELYAVEVTEGEGIWDGRDRGGEPVPSGVYVVRVETEGGRGRRGPVFRPLAVRW